jgi:hypothetical protein
MTKRSIRFDMHLRVPHDRISTIIEALTGACEVIRIEQYDPEKKTKSARTRATPGQHYQGGNRNKGISGVQLLKDLLATGPKTVQQIRNEFIKRGFAATSPSPIISLGKKEKWAKVDAETGMISAMKGGT